MDEWENFLLVRASSKEDFDCFEVLRSPVCGTQIRPITYTMLSQTQTIHDMAQALRRKMLV